MIAKYIKYFEDLLKNSGAKIVHDSVKKIENSSSGSFTAVLVLGEELTKSFKKYDYIDENHSRIRRNEKYKRKINFQILIGERNISKVENIFTKFVSEIEEKFKLENGEVALIELGKAEYIDKKDTILKSEITLQLEVYVTEVIFKDTPYKNINWKGGGEYVEESC